MFKKINSKLENLFDGTQSPQFSTPEQKPTFDNSKKDFEIEDDISTLQNLSYAFSNEELTLEKLPHLLSRLALYFEAGFLMQKASTTTQYKIASAFAYSKKIELQDSPRALRLPQIEFDKILKIKASNFLKHFNLDNLDPEKKMNCYLIPLSKKYYLVVATPLAEPWAQLRIETLQKTLLKINFSL